MKIIEGLAKIDVSVPKKVSKEMEVFYNPEMKSNRDMTINLLNCVPDKGMQIADLLAGTGIRSVRLLKELDFGKIKRLCANDHSAKSATQIKKNVKSNKCKGKFEVYSLDANIFLLESTGFDYIDVDPFGSPARFLDASCERLARNGILAITATDTAALCGSSPNACNRKYFATPMRNDYMHESGLRIMIRRAQLSAMQHEKALVPLFSYSEKHYMRAFLRCVKGRDPASNIYDEHGYISHCRKCLTNVASKKTIDKCFCGSSMEHAGPMWLGKLGDKSLVEKMAKKQSDQKEFLTTLSRELQIINQWYYNLNTVCSKYKISNPKKIDFVIEKIRKEGYLAERTIFDLAAVRSDAPIRAIAKALI
jgi:tRNA (guanine26-N2/guanine27-N2)-dimethyltransferase